MFFSRIYQLSPAADGAIAVDAAPAGSNADAVHESLFDALRAAFHGNTRRQHGAFDAQADAALPASLASYRADTLAAEAFGLALAEALRNALPDGALQQPWYLWCVIDRAAAESLYLFLLRQEESHRLTPQHTIVADGAIRPDRLQFAARVNLDEWQAGADTCITHLAPRAQTPLGAAWQALVGFAEKAGQAEQTAALLAAVDRYADELPEEKERECRARVAEYCIEQDRAGAPVELRDLSRHVDADEPAALLDFLAQHMEETATPLYADRRQLKHYTRLFGRDHDLSIGFSTQLLGSHIVYDEQAGTLTIRSIPKSLKSQLQRHLRRSE